MRKPCYNIYSKIFKCNLKEIDDITQYKNLAAFFCRDLKANVRKIDKASLVSNLPLPISKIKN